STVFRKLLMMLRTHFKHYIVKTDNNENDKHSLPEEPTTCCMSGCANCVWIEYAEQVTKLFEDGGEKAKELILEKVKDPNTRAFLMMELKNLANKS
ncbi:hypothetical protein L9F63_028406, partial [Diploptera punctata]